MKHLLDVIYEPYSGTWHQKAEAALQSLWEDGRYPKSAEKAVTIRAPGGLSLESGGAPFAALIHPENPNSGAYGGMSFVIFPADIGPALVAMVVGTQGLHPDEMVLGRPGHARKLAAITRWLNLEAGSGQLVAWSKDEPVRTDVTLPRDIRSKFSAYKNAFDRYGHVIYCFFAPQQDRASTEIALKAFLDLTFEERGISTRKPFEEDAEKIRAAYFQPPHA